MNKKKEDAKKSLHEIHDYYIKLLGNKDANLPSVQSIKTRVENFCPSFEKAEADIASLNAIIADFDQSVIVKFYSGIPAREARCVAYERKLQDLQTQTEEHEKVIHQLRQHKTDQNLISTFKEQAKEQKRSSLYFFWEFYCYSSDCLRYFILFDLPRWQNWHSRV